MKITIEAETKEEKKNVDKDIIFENVSQFIITGMKVDKLIPNDFRYKYGVYNYLIGRTYSVLKELEREFNRIENISIKKGDK